MAFRFRAHCQNSGIALTGILLILVHATRLQAAGMTRYYHQVSVGSRIHLLNEKLESLPLSNGDRSFLLLYDINELGINGYWQIGAGLTPSPDGTPETNDLVTPQVNILFRDKNFSWGVGVLQSYLRTLRESYWTDLYGQIIIRYLIPVNKTIALDLNGYYVLDDWKRAAKIDYKKLEFGILINFQL